MRKFLRIFLRTLAFAGEFIMAFLTLYLSLALILSLIPVGEEEATSGIPVYIKTNGIHTDICVPAVTKEMDWHSFLPPSDFPLVKNHNHVSIGWGDKGFFLDTPTWADLKFSTAFNAAFTGSPTAMHVAYYETAPQESEVTKKKYVSVEKYIDLVAYMKESFKTTNGKVELIPGRGYWANDNFYEAHGAYHLFNTCNAWTNAGLKIAGIRTAALALFSDGIMRHLK